MIRAVIVAVLVLCGCEDSAPPVAPPADGAYAELAGSWSSTLASTPYGPVAGSAQVEASGLIAFVASAKGTSVSGQAQIVAWTGESLTVAGTDGKQASVRASLAGDQLTVFVPGVGDVVLTRAPSD